MYSTEAKFYVTRSSGIISFLLILLISYRSPAQQPVKLTLKEALNLAERNYPSIKAKMFGIEASKLNLVLQKQEWLPRLDLNLQVVTSTLNNIYGLSFPQDIVLPISGPVRTTNSYERVWGSAGGLLLFWQPITFGERKQKIILASAEVRLASNDLANEVFNHDLLIIDTWLDYIAANSVIRSQVSNLDRVQALYGSVKVLADKGLKPGVDTMMLKGEISKARTELNNSRLTSALYKLQTAELLGMTDTTFIIDEQNFLSEKPFTPNPGSDSINLNPGIVLNRSILDAETARLTLAKKSYHPRLGIYETSFARGSGADINGNNDYSVGGLSPSKYNYAIGLTMTYPIFQYFPNHSQIRIQENHVLRQQSLYEEQELKLRNDLKGAEARMVTAFKNLGEYQTRLNASEAAYLQMNTRYSSGLATIVELFTTQYELARVETENSIANLSVWKAYLNYVRAAGNIKVFTDQVK